MTEGIIINKNGTGIFRHSRHHAESDDYDEDEFSSPTACHKPFRFYNINTFLSQYKNMKL